MKKRIFDLISASAALIAAAIPMVVIFASLKVALGGNVIYKQKRLGKNSIPFTILKFKTMTDDVDSKGKQLSDKARVTKLGNFLRRTGLDELPQIFNILSGDMSMVGPRPLRASFYERDPNGSRRRELKHVVLSVKPGIFSPSKVQAIKNGKAPTYKQRDESDLAYATALVSLRKDFMIVVRSFGVLTGKNPQPTIDNPEPDNTPS